MSRHFFILPFIFFALMAKISFAADVVVLSSQGVPNLRTGIIMSTTEDVIIPKGAHFIFITEHGFKIKIEGPFEGSLFSRMNTTADNSSKSAGSNLINSFAKLFNSPVFSTKAVGAFRSLAAPALSDPWAFDVHKGGTVCYQNAQNLKLWRAVIHQTDTASLQSKDDTVLFELPKGQAFVQWPIDVEINDNLEYDLTLSDNNAVSIKLRTVPKDMPTRMHTAAWMAEHGCPDQATLLIVNADIDKLLQGLAQSGKF